MIGGERGLPSGPNRKFCHRLMKVAGATFGFLLLLFLNSASYFGKCPLESKVNKTALFGLCSTTMALSLNTHAMHFRHYSWLSIINIKIHHYHWWGNTDLHSKIAFQTSGSPQHKENIFQRSRKKRLASPEIINISLVLFSGITHNHRYLLIWKAAGIQL